MTTPKDDLTYMTPGERARYASGEWMGWLECDNCGEELIPDAEAHDCPVIGTWVRVGRTQVP